MPSLGSKLTRGREFLGARLLGTVTQVQTEEPVVALTFDDGPDPQITPRLLDLLGRHGARSTFFMLGIHAARYPELVRLVAREGHAIGNHSWDHPSFPLIPRAERREQVRACARVITPAAGKLFRPPYGHQNLASRLDLLWLGYEVVTWSVAAEDWLPARPEELVARVMGTFQPGSIVLCHETLFDFLEGEYVDREPLLRAIDILLSDLSESYQFITLPDLLTRGTPRRENWYWEADVGFLNRLKRRDGKPRRYVAGDGP